MDVRSQPIPDTVCLFFRQYFCCRRKRRWNPINQRNPKVRREKSRVTFAVKVNKVEPIRYESPSSCSEDYSESRFPLEEENGREIDKTSEENLSTTALLDESLTDESSNSDSEYEEGEIMTLEAFVERYVKDTIAAALKQWKKDTERSRRNSDVLEDIEEEDLV